MTAQLEYKLLERCEDTKDEQNKKLKTTARQWSVDFTKYHFRVFKHKTEKTE